MNNNPHMNNRVRLMALLAIVILTGMKLSAQCVPDTVNCEDIGDPGQFCPVDLPLAVVNVLYDEVVTVIPPGTYEILSSTVTISYIIIDSVNNLPPGIDYYPNADILYPDTAYCIQLTGTPTQAGEFRLSIYISPFVDIQGTPTFFSQVVDDSSIVITVQETAGIDPNQVTEFQVFQNVPNPFSEVTRLGFYTPFEERIELNVYNILGVMVHQESELVPPGKHHFGFNGNALQPGTYFYRVANSEALFTGKFVKSR